MAKTAKVYIDSKDLEDLGRKVIAKEGLHTGGATIGYQFVDPIISKTVAGNCILTNGVLRHYSGFDYIVQMSKKTWDAIDEQTRYILMLHELKHIYAEETEDGYKYKLADHDVQDFHDLIQKYGVNWLNTLKIQTASDNNLDLSTLKLKL
jgi:hypothetical protein